MADLLHELRDAGRAGVRSMRRAEGIVHVEVAEFRQGLGKGRIVCFFTRMEPDVLEQGDVALIHVTDDFFRDLPDGVVTESDRMIDQRVQIIGDWPQRIFLNRLPFRPAEVRHQDRLRTVFAEIINRGKTFADAGVIGDGEVPIALFRRHIEIDADQDTLSAHVEISQGKFVHCEWAFLACHSERIEEPLTGSPAFKRWAARLNPGTF